MQCIWRMRQDFELKNVMSALTKGVPDVDAATPPARCTTSARWLMQCARGRAAAELRGHH